MHRLPRPAYGDVWIVRLDPVVGHEQGGRCRTINLAAPPAGAGGAPLGASAGADSAVVNAPAQYRRANPDRPQISAFYWHLAFFHHPDAYVSLELKRRPAPHTTAKGTGPVHLAHYDTIDGRTDTRQGRPTREARARTPALRKVAYAVMPPGQRLCAARYPAPRPLRRRG